jgi:transposase
MAVPMLEAIAPAKLLIADKAYDADRLRTWLQNKGIEAVIPGRAARSVVYTLNRTAYRRRNVIERMFGRLKNWKRIATRSDRLAVTSLAAIVLGATLTQWLGCVPYLERRARRSTLAGRTSTVSCRRSNLPSDSGVTLQLAH